MKIATYNVNGVNGRLPVLLRWLNESKPDIVCIQELRRVLPGDPEDSHSRYIEAIVNNIVIGCLYLPNGNPWPGPKFEYKLKWFKRLTTHAKKLFAQKIPVAL